MKSKNNKNKNKNSNLIEDQFPRTRKTSGYFETYSFRVPRSAKRVKHNFKFSDDWMPMLYSMGFDGKRVRDSGNPGTVGVAYMSEYYEVTTSFAKEKYERFEITSFQYDPERHVGEIVVQHQPNVLRDRDRKVNIIIQWVQVTEEEEDDDNNDDVGNSNIKKHCDISVMRLKLPAGVLNFGLFKVKPKALQYREDCYEELQLYLSH